jgi:polysaccharide export outer membrane protein
MILFDFLTSRRCLFLPLLVFSLSACTFLPGMSARYSKTAVVIESPEEPATQDYTLVKVTPKLLNDMAAERLAEEKREKGALGIINSNSEVYKLGPHDVLRIFVWGNPDLSPVVTTMTTGNVASTPAGRTINERGEIFFPMVGNIKAAGLTIPQFRESLTKQLNRFIKDAQVEVDVAGFRSQKVFVSGEVKVPGIVPISDVPLRITDAIGVAGGLTQEADLYNVVLTRAKQSEQIDMNRVYYGGELSANIILKNGDILSVPDRQVRKIFVLGEVGTAQGINQSRSYVMRRGRMSLSEVLSDAGGLNPFSSAAGKVFVMRADSNGEPIIYQLNASSAESLVMAEKFAMQPRDVVFVSPTDITEFGRFIGQFFPLTSATATVQSTPF